MPDQFYLLAIYDLLLKKKCVCLHQNFLHVVSLLKEVYAMV